MDNPKASGGSFSINECLFKCVGCFKLMNEGIKMCETGHSSCESCAQIILCPICGKKNTKTSNLVLKTIISEYLEEKQKTQASHATPEARRNANVSHEIANKNAKKIKLATKTNTTINKSGRPPFKLY